VGRPALEDCEEEKVEMAFERLSTHDVRRAYTS
jgi:hypothetical protein